MREQRDDFPTDSFFTLEDEDFAEQLKHVLILIHCDVCHGCGKEIDIADIAWNNMSTEEGTPCTYVEIICQACDTSIAHFDSWYPGIDTDDELIHVIGSDGGNAY